MIGDGELLVGDDGRNGVQVRAQAFGHDPDFVHKLVALRTLIERICFLYEIKIKKNIFLLHFDLN